MRLLTGRELSGFVLDLNRGELLTPEDQLAGLRKQALDVLLVLGARAGQVVSKEELMSSVWPDVVVGEGSLVQAIGDIRRVLGDTGHRLIRNVARRGYILVPEGPSTPQIVAADPMPARALAPEHATALPPPLPSRPLQPRREVGSMNWLVAVPILAVVGHRRRVVHVQPLSEEQGGERTSRTEGATRARHPTCFACDAAVCRRGRVGQR